MGPPLDIQPRRCTLQSFDAVAKDATGRSVPRWTALGDVWAWLQPASGDLWRADTVEARVNYRVWLRYGSLTLDLTSKYRLVLDSHPIYLDTPEDEGMTHRWLVAPAVGKPSETV